MSRSFNPREVVALSDAPGVVEKISGVRPHRATLWRWYLKGKLRGFTLGRRVFTTTRDLKELIERDAGRAPDTKDRRDVESRGTDAAARIASVSIREGG